MKEENQDIPSNGEMKEAATVAGGGLGAEIAALFREIGLDTDLIELRGYEVKPAEFGG
jgi:pyruvate/2-oxoglutarate dehydrogenase complex dihydrolipoamide dehydrogenase (E3) component